MGIEKMKNRFIRHVLILLLCGLCHTAAFAYGYDRNDQSKAWGYQPVYNTSAQAPKYQFYSTSPYINSIGKSKYNSFEMSNGRPRRIGSIPDDDEDDEIGVVHPDRDEMPIGDTPWLFMLLMGAGYLAFRYRKKIRT